jgi:putative copper resistance protein D
VPSFDLSESGGIGLVLSRGVTDAAVLMVFGTLIFRAVVAPAGFALLPLPEAAAFRRRLARQGSVLAAIALLAMALWLVLVARSLADATGFGASIDAVWTVVHDTSFGHVLVAECGALVLVLVALMLPAPLDLLSLAPGAIMIVLHACHGHAFGMGLPVLRVSVTAHLLAAGAWLGSLPALALAVRRLPPSVSAALARRFSPVGLVCVSVLAVTAFYQGVILISSWSFLAHSAYGWTALLKLLLFLLLLGVAAFNRVYATPRLASARGGPPTLLYAITLEIGLGFAVILAAGLLASLSPGMRM